MHTAGFSILASLSLTPKTSLTDSAAAQGRVRLAKKLMAEAATQAPGATPADTTANALGVSPAKSMSALTDKSLTSVQLPVQKASHPIRPCSNHAKNLHCTHGSHCLGRPCLTSESTHAVYLPSSRSSPSQIHH